MSFSSDLKNELNNIIDKSIHCRSACLAGYISINGRMQEFEEKEALIIRVDSDDTEAGILRLIRMVTHIPDDMCLCQNEKKHHRKIVIIGADNIDEMMLRLKLSRYDNRFSVNPMLTQRECCKRAYLRGAFMAGGSIGNPEKSYQLEIATLSESEARRLSSILEKMNLCCGIVEHRDRYVVYIKDGDTISDMLGLMGASKSLMEFENIRILKDIRNGVNREVNCDTANMKKIARSSAKQIDDINYIISKNGIDFLPENLREIAVARIEYPYYSLKELGELFTPPLGKSGVSHRLRKISEYANELKNN